MKITHYKCPSCAEALFSEGTCLKCSRGHSYDLSRDGYVNLLVGAGRGTHGDNKEMLLARKRFLSYGFYRPMADAVSGFLLKYAKSGARLLDIGCGEGYYTEIFAHALDGAGLAPQIYAFDISRDAVRLAAKRHMGASLAVASAYHLPYTDGAFSLVTNLFSPLEPKEILRVLASDGTFVMVIPEREHLFGLKSAIYDTPYKNEPTSFDIEGFSLVEDVRMRESIVLHGDEIASLFAMTPYAYRTSREGRERIAALAELTTDIDFHILVYNKCK